MQQVKIGIIGIGGMGQAHINSIADLKNCYVSAVCDIDAEKIKNFNSENNVQAFADSDTFFKEADIEAVIIATPHYFHNTLAEKAFGYGKHVLTEKPIAVHKADAESMIAAAAKHPELKFAAMFNQRTIPAHRKIKQLIDNGELGEIRRVNWIITDWFRSEIYYTSGDWRATWKGEGGGVLLNQCPHQLDLLQWFFGVPTKIRANGAFGKYHKIEVEDEITAFLEYPNGATGVFIASTGEAPGTNRLEITAERGRLVYEDGKIEFKRNEIPVSEFSATTDQRFGTPDLWNIAIDVPSSNPFQHRDIIEDFANAIIKDIPVMAPAPEGINSLEIGNAMLLSVIKDKTIDLPMDSNEFAVELQKLIDNSKFTKEASAGMPAEEDFSRSF
ncbi:MAG: Gfo/Idh/MocA family oxidoreductase [Victivallaceae bacterium]|nr:Gfo/Idh/MocA family oxidoreductase [Victivallaceae bacterium]